jgi:hypothetical protein
MPQGRCMDDGAVNAVISPVKTRSYCRARERDFKGPRGRAARRGSVARPSPGWLEDEVCTRWNTVNQGDAGRTGVVRTKGKKIMWMAFKNFKTQSVHAVSLPAGMSPHGFAMYWPLEQIEGPITCHLCLKFAQRWQEQDPGLEALLPRHLRGCTHFAT